MRTMVAVTLLGLALTACGGGEGPGATPEETFESLRTVITNENWSAVLDFLPPSRRKQQEEEFEKGKNDPGAAMIAAAIGVDPEELKTMTLREFMAATFEKMAEKHPEDMEKMKAATIVESKINGDTATLTVKQGEKTEDLRFLKEGGRWYMASLN